MRLSRMLFACMFLLSVLFLPAHTALADTGPKPSMEFAFAQEFTGEPLTIVSGVLYECQQADCSDAAPLEELGPQGLYCEPESCSATAYGFADYHILEIEFSDGITRRSNVFETAGFDSAYTVTIRQNDLLVEAQANVDALSRTLIVALLCACLVLIGVAAVALIVFFVRRSAKS